MKKLLAPILFCLLLGLAIAGNAQAAPPSTAQIERLLQVMEAQKVIDQMIPAMMQQSNAMLDRQLASTQASDADKARAQRMMAAQESSLREMLAWNNLKPVYVRVYADTLSAEEVLAMTRFYESPEGRSVMQKMPQVIQRTMQEMQPLAQAAMQKMMAELEAELARDGDNKK